MNPLKGLPGTHELHGNKQIHTNIVLPDIGMIGLMNRAAVEHLIQFIFGNPTIKEFQKGQPLQYVLDKLSATVIICHRHVLKDC